MRIAAAPVAMNRFYGMLAGLLCGLALLLSVPVQAQPAQTPSGAQSFVEDLTQQVLQVLQKDSGNKPAIRKALYSVLQQAVDVQWVGDFVLGKYRRQATPEQQDRFRKLYADFMVLNYANRFSEYAGEQPKTIGVEPQGVGEFMVRTHIIRPGGQKDPVKVDYRVRKIADSYRIFDVIIEGVSMLNSQRSEFASVINRKGMDFLMDRMEQRIQNMK